MTDKYCPLRFREFGSQPHDQRCIGESCAWFDKCSQSHGEPRTYTVETQTRVRTETDAETAQEPRETAQDALDVDSREKLEADVRQILHSAYMLAWMHGNENRRGSSFGKLHTEFYNLLDRQAAITRHEALTQPDERDEQIAELTAERDNLAADLLACNRERELLRGALGVAIDHAHDILQLVDEGMA